MPAGQVIFMDNAHPSLSIGIPSGPTARGLDGYVASGDRQPHRSETASPLGWRRTA